MPVDKKKLQALSEQLGLKTGAQFARERAEQPVRETPRPSEKPAGPGARETLRDLTARLGLRTATQWAEERAAVQARCEAGDFEIDRVVPGEVLTRREGHFFLARRDYPLEHPHGILELGAVLSMRPDHLALTSPGGGLKQFNPRTALFMDTETTGLAGGTGTVAFLVGIGYFENDVFRLDQCFLRDYDDEEAMLDYLGERFERCEAVVGYNSKSFDLPLLRTRFIQNRLRFRLEDCPHYDLVHAARRFWKRRLRDCSLGSIEREVLGVARHGDVPSYLIPQLWLDYLHSRDARPLEGVFYHHRMDILSLVTLAAWLAQCLGAESGGFEHIEDRLSLVRVHFNQKHYEEVTQHAKDCLASDMAAPLRRECLEMLALACKRLGRFEEMQQTFEEILCEFPSDLEARLELAKHHEHRTRNLREAERLCAYEAFPPPHPPREDALGSRLERIRGKLRRGLRGGLQGDD